jgi:hypothetical protein
MKNTGTTRYVTSLIVAASVAVGTAQQPFPGPAVPPMPVIGSESASTPMPPAPPMPVVSNAPVMRPSGITTVLGSAWTTQNEPLPKAGVRLRSVTSGQIVSNSTTNEGGEFTFTGVGRDTYITELVDEAGDVQGVGDAFTIDDGQTVVTFIRLPERAGSAAAAGMAQVAGGLAGFFSGGVLGTVTAAALGAAAGAGIVALQNCDCPPVSPER